MRLSMMIDLMRPLDESLQLVTELEGAGLDQVLIPESYGYDAVSIAGYLACRTHRIEIGTGIVNVFSRTASVLAMTAATCDALTAGRFALGIGASGPQVVEGFHGLAFDRPTTRMREYTEACRAIWRRDGPFTFDGKTLHVPLPADHGSGLGKPLKLFTRPLRPHIPIWWGCIRPRSVGAAAEVADGWLPAFFVPERADAVWGSDLTSGLRRRDPQLLSLEIAAGGMVAIGEDLTGHRRQQILDRGRAHLALYIGAMGAPGMNFYNDLCRDYGWPDAARAIQESYLAGDSAAAEAAVPTELLDHLHLVGPAGYVKERLAAYRDAGVTVLTVEPIGADPVKTLEALRTLVDAA